MKGGQRRGAGEGKAETTREWRKSLKRNDDMQIRLRRGFGWRTNRSLESKSLKLCV